MVRWAINESLGCIECLNQAALRALLTVGLGDVGHAGSNENE